VPCPADLMIAYEVSSSVSSVKNNGPECLVPLGAGAILGYKEC